MNLGPIEYTVARIDGDYAYLLQAGQSQEEEKHLPPSFQRNADIDKTEHKPLRHSAVKSAGRKKADRKNQKKQKRNGRSPRINTVLSNTEFHNQRHTNKAACENQQIYKALSHRQYD